MRLPNLVTMVSLCLAACTSTPGVDVLALGPSDETTSSVKRPEAPVAASAAASVDPVIAEAEDAGLPLEPIALVETPRPAARPRPVTTGEIYGYSFRDAQPINFGKRSPRKLAVHGVDVSRWQGDIDWKKLRSVRTVVASPPRRTASSAPRSIFSSEPFGARSIPPVGRT